MKLAKLANRTLFVLSVVVTGSVAGAFVWALLFVMNLGISFVWDNVGGRFGIYFPLAACLVGGLVVGLFAKRFGPYPEDLDAVMAKVKRGSDMPPPNSAPSPMNAASAPAMAQKYTTIFEFFGSVMVAAPLGPSPPSPPSFPSP